MDGEDNYNRNTDAQAGERVWHKCFIASANEEDPNHILGG